MCEPVNIVRESSYPARWELRTEGDSHEIPILCSFGSAHSVSEGKKYEMRMAGRVKQRGGRGTSEKNVPEEL